VSVERIIEIVVAAFANLSAEQLNALIALGGLGIAAFAIYAVLTLAKELKRR
jgi:hypothetical protein